MADYNSGLPVRTENNGDVKSVIVDGTITSRLLTVNTDGSLNITDNGGSLTVDGSVTVSATDLDIRDLDAAQDNVAISDGTDTLAVNADGSLNITDNGGSLTVDATNLDIRDLSHVQDSVKIGDGVDFLTVNADGSINVVTQEDSGTEIINYDTSPAIAAGASDNHDWTSAAVSKLYQILATASGKLKIEVQIETAAASGVFNTIAVGFNSTATPNIDINLAKFADVPNGARIRVIRTNKDNQAQDVYSTIVAIEG